MLKIYVRKSSVDDKKTNASYDKEKLAKLKAKVIAILKEKDSEEYKKAIEYFNRDEIKYTHLEKSISGGWIEKAGYGIGTVRIWKGKKFKKVAPNKWVRVYEKEDRGAKSSMTRLIHKVQMCTTAEDLYNFCMSNHAIFQDANGVDLPIMDQLRAAIDERKNTTGTSLGNRKTSPNMKIEDEKKEAARKDAEMRNSNNELLEVSKKRSANLKQQKEKQDEINRTKYEMYEEEHRGNDKKAEKLQKQVDKLKKELEDLQDQEYELRKKGDDIVSGKKDSKVAKKQPAAEASNLGKTESGKEIKTQTNTKKHIAIAKGEVTEDADGNKILTVKKSKELKEAFKQMESMFKESLKDHKKGQNNRPFMAGYGVVDGYLCATDGRIAMRLKVDGLEEFRDRSCVKVIEEGDNYIITHDDTTFKYKTKEYIDGTYQSVEKETVRRDKYDYPNVSRVIPDNNSASMKLDNEAIVNKIKELKDIGYFDEHQWNDVINKDKKPYIEFNIKSGSVYFDDEKIGDVNNYSGDNFKVTFDYHLFVQSIAGNANEMAFNPDDIVGDVYTRSVTFSTNVSDVVVMPMNGDRSLPTSKQFKDSDEYQNQQKAKGMVADKEAAKQASKEEAEKRAMKDEAKSDILKNKPEGVTDRDYENLINYTDKFYTDLGYDNTTERAKQQIKRTVDIAVNKVNNKDFDLLESLESQDNKVSRKVFETLTAIPLGTNAESARKAWEKWVGHDAMKKYRDDEKAKVQAEKDRVAAEKKEREDFENKQYNGFLSSKTPAGRAKAIEILNKKGGFNGKVMTWQELADSYIANGGKANTYETMTSSGKKKPYYSISDKDGRGYEVPKTVYDYAMHISGKSVEKSLNIIMLDEYEHEDFEDFDATEPDLFNSIPNKVKVALEAVRCC